MRSLNLWELELRTRTGMTVIKQVKLHTNLVFGSVGFTIPCDTVFFLYCFSQRTQENLSKLILYVVKERAHLGRLFLK